MAKIVYDKSDLEGKQNLFREMFPGFMQKSMAQSMLHIGLIATKDFMTRPSFDFNDQSFGPKDNDDVLAIRSSRLARSLTEGFTFAGGLGGVKEGIRKVIKRGENKYEGVYGTEVPYAAVHEFGVNNKTITPRQRGFFWYRFRETKNNMWLALALSQTYSIKPRPFLNPAAEKAGPDIQKIFQRNMNEMIGKLNAI